MWLLVVILYGYAPPSDNYHVVRAAAESGE